VGAVSASGASRSCSVSWAGALLGVSRSAWPERGWLGGRGWLRVGVAAAALGLHRAVRGSAGARGGVGADEQGTVVGLAAVPRRAVVRL
jgi:hypothetical protein